MPMPPAALSTTRLVTTYWDSACAWNRFADRLQPWVLCNIHAATRSMKRGPSINDSQKIAECLKKIIHTNISTLQFVCMSSYLAIMNSQNFIQHQKYYWLDRHLLYNLYSKRLWYVPSHLYYNIQSWVLLSVQHHVLTLSLNLNQLKDFSNESKIYVVLMFIIIHCTTWC